MGSDEKPAKKKKPTIDDLLSQDVPQGPLRRGLGMRTSFEEAATLPQVQPLPSAAATDGVAQSHNRTDAIKRVNRGYKLREDLIKRCKRVALDEDRNLYDVMEEALEMYLEQKETH